MTIGKCLKTNGLTIHCKTGLHRCGTVQVFYHNPNTQAEESICLNIMFPLCKSGELELTTRFKDFCKKNGFHHDTVTEIRLIKLAETMNDLTVNNTTPTLTK